MTVTGKWSPCLYLSSWALPSYFFPVSCWREWEWESSLVGTWQPAEVNPPHTLRIYPALIIDEQCRHLPRCRDKNKTMLLICAKWKVLPSTTRRMSSKDAVIIYFICTAVLNLYAMFTNHIEGFLKYHIQKFWQITVRWNLSPHWYFLPPKYICSGVKYTIFC